MISEKDRQGISPFLNYHAQKNKVNQFLGNSTTPISGKVVVEKALEENSAAIERLKSLLGETSDGTD